ncbi:hypothetical protein [Dongia sp. agr-C8]
MRRPMVVLLLGAAAQACSTPTTSGSGAEREGRFAKASMHLGTCTAMGAHVRNPDLYLAIGGGEGDYSILASRTKDGSPIWAISMDDAGADSSTVRLRGSGASAAELEEIWRVVEFCETYEPG